MTIDLPNFPQTPTHMTLEDLRVSGYFQTDHSSESGMLYLGSPQSLKLAVSRAITSMWTLGPDLTQLILAPRKV